MITKERIDEYVERIQEVKAELEARQWFPIRHDEWSSPLGDTIRFGYSHVEFRIFTNYIGRGTESHIIPVRPAEVAHVPTVEEILTDILNVDLASWESNRPAVT